MRGFSVEEIKLPSLGESVTEGQVATWLKQKGDIVAEDEPIVAIESDKMGQEIRTTHAGEIVEVLYSEGDEVQVGEVLFKIDTSKAGEAKAAPAAPATPAAETPAPQAAANTAAAKPAAKPARAATPPPAAPVQAGARTERREPISPIRQKIQHAMKDTQNTAACLTTFQECDMSEVINLQSSLSAEFEKTHGYSLSFMSFFVMAASRALQQFPVSNAQIEGNEVVYKDYADIAVTLATPEGSVSPVIRNAESKKFKEIEEKLAGLVEGAQDGSLPLEDLAGGTFTITNQGVFDGYLGTPMLVQPQSAILGIHNIENRSVCEGDEVTARPMMNLALTYDHRLLDGKDAVLFLRKIKNLVEEPIRILLRL